MVEVYGEPPKTAALFVNSNSRRGATWLDSSHRHLTKSGLTLTRIHSFNSSVEMQDAVKEEIRAKTPLIIVGGGDGTFSSIAHHFAHSETVLGVLPFGTGNAFARDLLIPAEVAHACDIILNGKVACVDMGTVGNRQFLNVATIGLTTQVAEGLNGNLKRVFGRAVYIVSVLRALATTQPFLVKLRLPDRLETFECLQMVIGNGRFHAGPFPIAPDATITGGFLAIYALATRDKRAFIRLAVHMSNGHHIDLAEVKYFRADHGVLQTVPSQELIVDGEICFRTPQEFSMSKRALPVIVPQSFNS